MASDGIARQFPESAIGARSQRLQSARLWTDTGCADRKNVKGNERFPRAWMRWVTRA